MLSKARHLLPRPARRRGPAGSGLFDRVRATTFAMLGGTAAFCLVLVALLAQQGVPYLPALPIPGAGNGDEAVSGASAVARIGDPIDVLVRAPAGIPAGPDRIPAGSTGGTGSRPDSDSSSPGQGGGPAEDSQPDVGSGGGSQPATGSPPPVSAPQSSPVSNPSPSGSGGSSGSQSGSSGNAEADAVSAAGGSSGLKPAGTPPTTATTAAQQAAAPPATAPPAPAPSSPAAAEEAAAEEAAAAP
ncbi:MAG TPA: hypothetical protein VFX45_11715 [Solirubrobacterales bacterium]|nr:hypothetical protein [Solirubrobacterales bacterium]